MNTRIPRKIWLTGLFLSAVLLLTFGAIAQTKQPVKGGHELALQVPLFVQTAYADENTATAVNDLADEAGISAYYQTANPIDLNSVRSQFKTIETETADYIIGSVDLPAYPENFDAHVYVHTDGWIMAYYLNTEPTAKIANVRDSLISSTNLETILSIIAGAAGSAFTGGTYYDFRYPNATNILLVAEDNNDGRDFTIELPSAYAYYERSWAAYNGDGRYPDMWLNGSQLSAQFDGWNTAYGTMTAGQLSLDTPHTFETSHRSYCYGVVSITYRVP